MGNEVYANGREISCKAADGKAVAAFPDVCFTPPSTLATPTGVPIPYPNTGFATDATNGSKTVKITGKEVMLKNVSYFKKSTGDEPATRSLAQGVITHTITGKVYFNSWSMDVKVEGENVDRHMDLTTHNHMSVPGNTPTWPYLDQMTMASDDPCRRDAARINFSCSGNEEDCPTPGPGYKESDCVRAKRCMLVPYSPNKCCPGQTPHHLVPKRGFKGNTGYNPNKAPCVCAEGSSWHRSSTKFPAQDQTHADMHDIQDSFERRMMNNPPPGTPPGASMNYGQARDAGIAAHQEVFKDSGCDPECIEKQLDSYHKGECGIQDNTPLTEGRVRHLETLEESAKPELFAKSEEIFSRLANTGTPQTTAF